MTMKKLRYLTIVLLSGFIFTTCDDFLDEQNPNTITDQSFWITEQDFNKGLMAVYRTLQSGSVMGGDNATTGHVLSDIVTPNPWGSAQLEMHNHYVSDVNSFVVNKWHQLYTGIFRANQVLEHLSNANLSESFKIKIESETRF